LDYNTLSYGGRVLKFMHKYHVVILVALSVGLNVVACSDDPVEPPAIVVDHSYVVVPDDFQTIREALNKVDFEGTVFIKNGTYEENNLELPRGCSLIGESESGTIIDAQNLTDYNRHTILRIRDDGETINRTIVKNISFYNNNRVYAVSTSFPDITFSNCSFKQSKCGLAFGGSENGDVLIESCRFENNGRLEGQSGEAAGAICINQNTVTSFQIQQCTFVNNKGRIGGAIQVDRSRGNLSISDCSFANNEAGNGGAISILELHDLVLSNCVFDNNYLSESSWPNNAGGAVMLSGIRNFYIRDTLFRDNKSYGGAGAVNASHCSFGSFTDCLFSDNKGLRGGACNTSWGNYNFEYCFFIGNGRQIEEHNNVSVGGALYLGFNGSVSVDRSTFFGNYAYGGMTYDEGTGSCVYLSSVTSACLITSSIFSSSAIGTPVDGDGLLWWFKYNVVFDNEDDDWGGLLIGMDGIDGNISEDPLFCDPTEDNFNLSPESPFIGNNGPFRGAGGMGCD